MESVAGISLRIEQINSLVIIKTLVQTHMWSK